MKKKKRKIKVGRILTIVILLGTVIYGTTYLLKIMEKKPFSEEPNKPTEKEPAVVKKLTIVDEDSKSRPYAIMINNHHEAWPQSGLQDAYLIYEIVAEGGITRMLALFKDKNTVKIGSVRSSRHYYLDYAMENDAIYVHFGWSPQAEKDIKNLKINNINGMYDSGFYRDTSLKRAYEHTAFTDLEKLDKVATNKNYRKETERDLLLNYSVDDININDKEGAIAANNIDIVYSNYHTSSYSYDETTKTYYRSMSGQKHVDLVTGKQYTFKNIIITPIENSSIDSYGRQELSNIGSGDGYYITNGYAVPITWNKSSRSGQTVYKYLDGKEITVNDGNTFIQIQPLGQKLTIE